MGNVTSSHKRAQNRPSSRYSNLPDCVVASPQSTFPNNVGNPMTPNGVYDAYTVDQGPAGSSAPDPRAPASTRASQAYSLDLTKETHRISVVHIYDGTYSRVYIGQWRGQEVAIKAIKCLRNDSLRATRRRVRREASASHFNHPNILPVYGIMEPNWCKFGCIVTPWCRNGDASNYVRNIETPGRIELVSGVAAGLEYLHGLSIVHGDIKPGNILIDDDGRPLIGDFGLIWYLDDAQGIDNTTTVHNGTTRYLAYELVKPDPPEPRSRPSDIHALGCVAFELILRTQPYATRPNTAVGHRRITLDIADGTPPAFRPEDPLESSSAILWDLLEGCWDKDPIGRLTIAGVRDALKVLMEQGL